MSRGPLTLAYNGEVFNFAKLRAALQAKGRRVSVVSTLQTQPPMIADELRRAADTFIELADLAELVGRGLDGAYLGSCDGAAGRRG